jgi:hypothetical protein
MGLRKEVSTYDKKEGLQRFFEMIKHQEILDK